MGEFIGIVIMTSSFFTSHREELEKMATYYEKKPNLELKYRAKCIRELLKWEGIKDEM